jgi:hypothetical protein
LSKVNGPWDDRPSAGPFSLPQELSGIIRDQESQNAGAMSGLPPPPGASPSLCTAIVHIEFIEKNAYSIGV